MVENLSKKLNWKPLHRVVKEKKEKRQEKKHMVPSNGKGKAKAKQRQSRGKHEANGLV